MRSINTFLILLQEYLPVRNPCLLLRDQVSNRYYLDIAPEISEEEKNHWNNSNFISLKQTQLFLKDGLILYGGDDDILRLPRPKSLTDPNCALIIQPVIYNNNDLPVCILVIYIHDYNKLPKIKLLIRIIANMLAMAMTAKGFSSSGHKQLPARKGAIPKVMDNIIGNSEALLQLAQTVKKIAVSKVTVLIQGESGTGKELVAKTLHDNSFHKKAPFIGVNCAALSETLLESELFGHEKGAFTGATSFRKGRFELANGGTLFLDEIGDTSLNFQRKILRVLQEGQFERLGGIKTIDIDVRIICATNVDLEEAMKLGHFREDLYYRLNVINLQIPPLRHRRDDIPYLIQHFLERLNLNSNLNIQIRPEDIKHLQNQSWPGNVRELENAIHSAFVMEQDGFLSFKQSNFNGYRQPSQSNSQKFNIKTLNNDAIIEKEEIKAIDEALRLSKGNQKQAATHLGISLRQLRYRVQKYGLLVRKIQV
ncbi:MAG: sigma-54 dependent transcriptional regulator [Deltaproteobacteria bacterium]|nr:sigma-54 dependent transcriptional regulator [Deltaproteobacteria bacterium]